MNARILLQDAREEAISRMEDRGLSSLVPKMPDDDAVCGEDSRI